MAEKKSQEEWNQIEADGNRRKEVVNAIRGLMKETYQKYRKAVQHLHGQELITFQHYQSPTRILAIDPRLPHLAELLKEQKTWDMLTRGEKRFIANACKLAKIAS